MSGWWITGLDTEESRTYSRADTGQDQWRCKCNRCSISPLALIIIITTKQCN